MESHRCCTFWANPHVAASVFYSWMHSSNHSRIHSINEWDLNMPETSIIIFCHYFLWKYFEICCLSWKIYCQLVKNVDSEYSQQDFDMTLIWSVKCRIRAHGGIFSFRKVYTEEKHQSFLFLFSINSPLGPVTLRNKVHLNSLEWHHLNL